MDTFRKTDTEVVDIDISGLPTDGELGLILDGGRDEHSMPGDDTGVYVVSIAKDSVCDGKLRPNDCVVKVNNLDCSNVSRRIVLESIRSSAPRCQVVVRRQLMNAMHLYTTQLNLKCGRAHGLGFESGMHIAKIEAGSLAARDKNLAVGDRIISINKRAIDGMTNPNDVLMQLDDNRNESAVIVGLKQIGLNAAKLMHNNKMVNSCTQTETPSAGHHHHHDVGKYYEEGKRMSVHGGLVGSSGMGGNSGNNSGGGFLGGGGLEAMSMSKSTGHGLSSPPSGSGGSTSAKSTSKLTELLKIIRGKTHKYSGDSNEDSQAQNEAISLLDSVLNNSETGNNAGGSKSTSVKRAKRKKDSKESSNGKSMGTWPRANVIAHENLSGTIVQKPKSKRPTLSVFNSAITGSGQQQQQIQNVSTDVDNNNASDDGGEEEEVEEITNSGVTKQFYDHPSSSSQSAKTSSQVQASNPGFVPVINPQSRKNTAPYLMNRHSVYGGTMDSSHSPVMNPILMPKPIHSLPSGSGTAMTTQTLSRMARHNNAMDYERQQLAAMNRMSLNFTPSDQSLFYGGGGDQGATANAISMMKQKSSTIGGGNTSAGHFTNNATQQQQNQPFLSGYHQPSPSSYKLAPIDLPVVKPPSRDSLDVYGVKKFQRNDYLGAAELGSGQTSTLPAYMRNHGSSQMYATTNRNAGPKMLPMGSPMQSPITTQADSTGMLANAASGSISEKSAFDSYMSSSYHHQAASIDYQYNKHRYQQQHQPSREEIATGHYGVAG